MALPTALSCANALDYAWRIMKAATKLSIMSLRRTDSGQHRAKLQVDVDVANGVPCNFGNPMLAGKQAFSRYERVHSASIRFSLRINVIFLQFEI